MKRVCTLAGAVGLLLLPAFPALAQAEAAPGGRDLMWVTWIGSVAALLFALILALGVLRKSPGNSTMQDLSRAVLEGATAYLKQQYKIVGLFFALLFVVLAIISYGLQLLSPFVPFAFITGGFFSALAGFIGMSIATRANSRTAQGASESLNAGLRVAFSSGTVMGMTVVGLGLLDIAIWWFLLRFAFDVPVVEIPPIMITFGMGASLQALFARLGGGIFTKAADVGADLVGKVEANIPEDDARNPATIADNVGDNVGDVAGMGADLYESYVGSIIATMALGAIASLNLPEVSALQMIQVPVSVATIGVLCSILGTAVVRTKGEASQHVLLRALRNGTLLSTGLIAVLSLVLVLLTAGPSFVGLWGAMIVGLVAGNVIGYFTEYYTSDNYGPTKALAAEAQTGPATLIIQGHALGMVSTLVPVVTVVVATLLAFFLSGGAQFAGIGLYGIGLAAVGMLSTLGITLATDAYGPVADNAGGIAEMAEMDPQVRERTDALDSLGNTTAATGKGFAIGSAALTALALLAEYRNKIVEALDTVAVSQFFERFYTGIITITRDANGAVQHAEMSINLMGSQDPDGAVHRRRAAVRVRLAVDEGGGPRRRRHGQGGAAPVPGQSRNPQGRGAARLRLLRGNLHQGSAAGDGGTFDSGGSGPDRGGNRVRSLHRDRAAGRGADHRFRAGDHDGQRRRRLGQRQEVRGGGQLRRQGLGGAQGGGDRRHRRRSLQGHLRTVDQHPASS